MLPSETMIWQPEFTDKTLSRKTGAVHWLVDTNSPYQQSAVHIPA
ncbi:PapI protein [Escherichia coli]|nr:PapI protein [Escherichia coli]